MRKTLENLYRFIPRRILTGNDISLYVFLKLHEREPLPLSKISKAVGLSTTNVVFRITVFEMLGILRVQRKAAAHRTNIYHPLPLSDSDAITLLGNNTLLQKINKLKDAKIHKYHPKGYSVDKEDIILIKRKRDLSSALSEPLKLVVRYIPEKFASMFRVTPDLERRLRKLSEKLDLEVYTKWFMTRKLGVTVDHFGLGIFLYEGIIDEYRVVRSKLEKTKRYKAGKKVSKEAIKRTKRELEGLYG